MDFASLGIKVDATQVKEATRDLNNLAPAAQKAEQSTSGMEKSFSKANSEAKNLGRGISGVTALVGSMAAAFSAIQLAKELVKTVEQVQNLEVRMKGLTKSAQDYAEVEQYLSKLAQQHHKDNLVLTDSMSRLLTIEQAGITTRKQSIALLEGMSNAQSKTGAGSDQLKQSMFGLSQALGAGVLHMEELNQVTEPMPGLLNKIAEAAGYTGKSAVGDFRAVVEEGKVTSEMFGTIMVNALAGYQGAAEKAGDTLTAQYADVRNSWIELARVVEAPVSNTISPILDFISNQIKGLTQDLKELNQFYNAVFNSAKATAKGDNGMVVDLTGRAKPPTDSANTSKDIEAAKAIRAEIEATEGSQKKAHVAKKARATESEKLASKAMSDAKREAEAIVSAIQSEIKAQDNQLKKLTMTERSYKEYELSLLHMTDAVKASEMAKWDLIKAAEAEKRANDTGKSEMDSLVDRYNQLTLSARAYYEEKLKAQGLSPEKTKPLMDQFDKNTGAEVSNKSIEAAKDSMQAYDDLIKQVNESTQQLGATNNAVFDGALGGFSRIAGIFQNLGDSIKETTKQQEKLNTAFSKEKSDINKSKLDDRQKFTLMLGKEGDYLKANKKLEDDKTNQALTGMRQMVGATAELFDKKSSTAKALHNVEMGIAVAQMGMQAIQSAKTLAATAVDMAAGAAKFFAQSGWGGFAGVAAMAAVMAGLGYAAFGGSGGGSQQPPPVSGDTGTVLGDKSAKSDSINRTNELLKSIHADEYRELRGINSGISDLSKGITNVVAKMFQAGGLPGVSLAPTKLTGIAAGLTSIDPIMKMGFDPIGKAILGFLFGGKQTQSIVGQGIATGPSSVGNILKGDQFYASFFADIMTKTKGGIFTKDKTEYSRIYSQMDQGTTDALTHVFKSMGQTMYGLAEQLGDGLGERVKNYVIPALFIDLQGLNGEDAAKKVNGVISTMLDTMAGAVFGDIIGQYQQLGEGMLETAVRIVAEVAVVKDALGMSGMELKGNAIAISDALVQAAGGLKEFQSQFETYYEKFYSETEKQERLQKRLTETLAEVNIVLPKTREQYRKLIEGLDLANEADQRRYSMLLKLSEVADQYYSRESDLLKQHRSLEIQLMEALGNKSGALAASRRMELAEMDKSLRWMQKAIWALQDADQRVNDAMDALTRSVNARKKHQDEKLAGIIKDEQDKLDATLKANEAQKQAANDLASGIRDILSKINDALKSSVVESTALDRQRRSSAQALISRELDNVRAGGKLSGGKEMEQALADLAKPSQNLFASFQDYARDQGVTAGILDELAKNGEKQLTDAEKTIQAIDKASQAAQAASKAAIAAAQARHDKNIKRLDDILKKAQDQVDAANGNKKAILSVADAIKLLADALNEKKKLKEDIDEAGKANTAEGIAKEKYDKKSRLAEDADAKVAEAKGLADHRRAQAAELKKQAGLPMAAPPSTFKVGQSGNVVWENILSGFQREHKKRFGVEFTRGWDADADAMAQYQELVRRYYIDAKAFKSDQLKQSEDLLALVAAGAAERQALKADAAAKHEAEAAAKLEWDRAAKYADELRKKTAPKLAIGTNSIPYDMNVDIHAGERVMPAADNRELMMRLSQPSGNSQELIAELRALREEVVMLRAETRATVANTAKTAKILDRVSPDGDALSARVVA
ncbi:MAG: tape measure protein [Methylococcaceae bacterium]